MIFEQSNQQCWGRRSSKQTLVLLHSWSLGATQREVPIVKPKATSKRKINLKCNYRMTVMSSRTGGYKYPPGRGIDIWEKTRAKEVCLGHFSTKGRKMTNKKADGYRNTLLKSPLLSEFVSSSSEKTSMTFQAKFQRVNCEVHSGPKGSRKNVRGLLKFPSGLLDDGRGTLLARSRRALQGVLNEFIVGLLQHPDPTSNNGNSAIYYRGSNYDMRVCTDEMHSGKLFMRPTSKS
nr:uncharacterized protein LOC110359644 [Columba livia]